MNGIIFFLSVKVCILAYCRPLWKSELITSALALLKTIFPCIRVDPLS